MSHRFSRWGMILCGIMAGLMLLPLQGTAAEKTEDVQKKELGEKAEEEAKKEADRQAMERIRQERLDELKAQQEKVMQEQAEVQEKVARYLFPNLTFKLDKTAYKAGEAITPTFAVVNGSSSPFWVDGRKLYPKVEVTDKKGNQMSIHQPYQEIAPPTEQDLILLKPGEAFTPPPVSFKIEKAGTYKVQMIYTFRAPEKKTRWTWFGNIHSPQRTVTVTR